MTLDSSKMFSFRQVAKIYGAHPALYDINLDILEGETLVIVGPNGSGKTTLLRLMIALSAASRGEIFFRGEPIRKTRKELHRCLGYLPDHPLLYQQLTLRENIELLARMFDTSKAGLIDACHTYALGEALDQRLLALSKGMIQRAMIALMTMRNCSLVVLDEPFTGLDSEGQSLLARYVRERKRGGQTTIIVSHFLGPIDTEWTRMIALRNGSIIRDTKLGSPHTRLIEAYREAYAL